MSKAAKRKSKPQEVEPIRFALPPIEELRADFIRRVELLHRAGHNDTSLEVGAGVARRFIGDRLRKGEGFTYGSAAMFSAYLAEVEKKEAAKAAKSNAG